MSGFISYITLKTQQNSLSSKMATQISAISENYVLVQHTTRLKTISHKVNLIYSTPQPPRRLGHCTLIQAEFVKDRVELKAV